MCWKLLPSLPTPKEKKRKDVLKQRDQPRTFFTDTERKKEEGRAETTRSTTIGKEPMQTGFEVGENYCPGELDGWNLCWNATPPGEVARHPCPENNSASAFRECTLNGTWFVHPDSKDGKSWTNYTQCIDQEMLSFSKKINLLYEIGYSVSLVTLILSLAVFFLFRSLKCTRIRLHIHLFISLALNNIAWILWYELVIFKAGDDTRVLENPVSHLKQILTNTKYYVNSKFTEF
ncbi:7 transmembrane receptor (Secretin family) [Popillia japonica]|uniref:7 transmembrane receptor (Secretin family) n=1 Tax=Popillia japonica TaxID=7064 RepID=A0AAW1MCX9_POPJA